MAGGITSTLHITTPLRASRRSLSRLLSLYCPPAHAGCVTAAICVDAVAERRRPMTERATGRPSDARRAKDVCPTPPPATSCATCAPCCSHAASPSPPPPGASRPSFSRVMSSGCVLRKDERRPLAPLAASAALPPSTSFSTGMTSCGAVGGQLRAARGAAAGGAPRGEVYSRPWRCRPRPAGAPRPSAGPCPSRGAQRSRACGSRAPPREAGPGAEPLGARSCCCVTTARETWRFAR